MPTRSSGVPVCSLVVSVIAGPDEGARALGEDALTIGTAPGNDLVLKDRTVSRYHLELRREGDRVLVTDMGSTNGTVIGAASFGGATVGVPAGTTIAIGATTLRIDDGEVHLTTLPRHAVAGIYGRSLPIARLTQSIEALAEKNAAVLILGESGTGKELVARALHELGPRASQPFVVVDCGALAPTLLASELFGHEKGAFTGADRRHAGAFERAAGGTVFLDEIGELPTEQQAALLGVLERRQLRRVGGSTEVPIDVRVIAATHRDLRSDVNSGRFRLDLYYRIAVVLLRVPPLRERPEDVPLLVEHFLREEGFDRPVELIFDGARMTELQRHAWPGNVRELRNFVCATLATGLAPELATRAPQPATANGESYRDARARAVGDFEHAYLTRLLAETNGNIREAARRGHMDRSHLMELMRRHGMR